MTELSDDEHDIDIESDEDEGGSPAGGMNFLSDAEKKAHHNALERRRRDHIKESFVKLRDAIPETKKEKTSRALILKKAHEYIKHMNHKALSAKKEIEKMRRQNIVLRQQIEAAERAQTNGSFALPDDLVSRNPGQDYDQSESSDGSENGDMRNGQERPMKKARF